MKVKFKKLVEHAVLPESENNLYPIIALDFAENRDYGYLEYGSGLTIEKQEGQTLLLLPTYLTEKTNVQLINPHVISGEEIVFKMKRMSNQVHRQALEPMVGEVIGYLLVL